MTYQLCKRIFLLMALGGCLLLPLLPARAAEDAAPLERINWQTLPALPQASGGQMAGVSNGALLVIGGSHFPVSIFEGGQKMWLDTAYVLAPGAREWQMAMKLDHPLAYGAAVSVDDGVIVIGGSDGVRHYAECFRLHWTGERVEKTSLPSLPMASANLGAALLGKVIYVAGGQAAPNSTEAMKSFWALDLTERAPQWRQLEAWPGTGRILPVVAAQDGAVYVVSGAELSVGTDGKAARRYLQDGYRYRPGQGWRRIADTPRPVVAAPVAVFGQAHILVFGGDDGANAQRVFELKDDHPGFSRDVLAYHTITDTWTQMGSLPTSLVTTAAVTWQNSIVIPGGEDRPGHRSAQLLSARSVAPRAPFGLINYAVLVAYLGANLLVGMWFARRQKNTNDYFRGGQRIQWWAAGIAIFGTQLSSLTFMAVPAKTYATDWTFILNNAAIILVAPIVVFFYRLSSAGWTSPARMSISNGASILPCACSAARRSC